MTDRQRHLLRVLADPIGGPVPLSSGDRAAIQAALDRIAALEMVVRAIEDDCADNVDAELLRHDYDAPDDAEYTVNVRAGTWRKLRAVASDEGVGCPGQHVWARRRVGGPPDAAESMEVVEHCDVCGVERVEG